MTWQISLGTLDLMTGAFYVDRMDTSTPGRVRMWLSIDGPTPKDIIDNVRLIEAQLNRASRQSQPASGSHWVTLDVRASASSTLVRYQVRRGRVTVPRDQVGGVPMSEGGYLPDVMVELDCLEHTAGEPIELGPFEVSADNPTLFLPAIPGDEPALVEMRIRDLSDGHVINRMLVGGKSVDGMEDGDFEPVVPLASAEDGEEDVDTFDGFFARLTAGANWQTIRRIGRAVNAFSSGLYDLYLRLRDATLTLGRPTNLTVDAAGAIARRQQRTTTFTDATSVTLSWSSSWRTEPGNFLVLMIGIQGSTASVTTPSGWTSAANITSSGSRAVCLYRYSPDPGLTSVTVNFGSAATGTIHLLEYRGIVSSSPVDRVVTTNNGITTTPSTGTTSAMTQNYGLGLAFFRSSGGGSVTVTTSGWAGIEASGGKAVAERIIESGGTHNVAASGSTAFWASLLVIFKGEATETGTVPAASYSVRVAAVDVLERLSEASEQVEVVLASDGSIYAAWHAGIGPVDHYRIYLRPDSDDWGFVVTDTAAVSFTIDDLTGITLEDPPDQSTIEPVAVRLRLGLESGVTDDLITSPMFAAIGNNIWEPAQFAREYLAPISAPLAADIPGWSVEAEAKGLNIDLDADALFLMPADEQQIDIRYTANNLAENHEWIFGTTPDLRSYGFLRDLSTGDEAGRIMPVGYCLLGPGDTTVVFLVTVAGGAWQIEDVAWEVYLTVVPQYRWLAGGA